MELPRLRSMQLHTNKWWIDDLQNVALDYDRLKIAKKKAKKSAKIAKLDPSESNMFFAEYDARDVAHVQELRAMSSGKPVPPFVNK